MRDRNRAHADEQLSYECLTDTSIPYLTGPLDGATFSGQLGAYVMD
jgi:hypothetical protein